MERFAGRLQQLPRRQGEMLRALHLAQEELGWISRDAIRLIARHLRVSEAQVYGPATFYAEFRHSPPPKTLVTWCSGPSCRVVGGDRVRRIFEAELGCRMSQNTADDELGLWLGQCNGTCEKAPMVWVNGPRGGSAVDGRHGQTGAPAEGRRRPGDLARASDQNRPGHVRQRRVDLWRRRHRACARFCE